MRALIGAASPVAKYRSDIDGLRALAVTSVCLFHAGVPLVSGGFVGVDVFFVISGYLIGGIINREVSAGDFSFAKFYARRARRILPALFALLVATSVIALFLLTPVELARYAKSAIGAIFAVSNVFFWLSTNYFSPAAELNPLLMTWTLGVEEQFYVFVPALIIVTYRLMPRRVSSVLAAIGIVSFLMCLWATGRFPAAAFYLLPTRAWELSIGMLLAIYEARSPAASIFRSIPPDVLSSLGFFLVCVSFFFVNGSTPFPGIAALMPVCGSALLIAGNGSFINARILSLPPLVFVGRISYSWYLWHWPLLSFARISTDGQLRLDRALVVLAISFCAAALSWRYVEQPFRAIRSPLLPTFRGYAIAATAAVAIMAVFVLRHGFPERFSPVIAREERIGLDLARDPCLVTYGVSEPSHEPTCMPSGQRHAVALLGDSHAAALGEALRMASAEQGYDFFELTKSSCPPLLGVTRRMPAHPQHERECSEFTDRTLRDLLNRPSIRTVVLAGYWSAPFVEQDTGSRYVRVSQVRESVSTAESSSNLEIGLARMVQALTAAHKRVVLALDVPMYRFDPLRHVETLGVPCRRLLLRILSTNTSIGQWSATEANLVDRPDPSIEILRSVAGRYRTAKVIDLSAAFCRHGRCSFADRAGLFYVDDQHLSLSGARRAIGSLDLAPL